MKKYLIFYSLLYSMLSYGQHTNQYSQYMFNGLIINPSYAGSSDALSINLLHRNQWVGFEGAPKITTLSAHSPLKNKKVNLGLSFVSEKYGVTRKNNFNAIYAYKIKLLSGSLSFGVQGGFALINNNWNDIQTTTSGDVVFVGQTEKYFSPQAGFGLYYSAKKYFIGISSPAIIQINNDSKNTFKPFLINTGYLFSLDDNIKLKPSVLLKFIKNSKPQADFNINAYYKEFGVGVSYRTNDATVFLLNYSVNKQFNVGYSYDLTISKLKTFNKGSHEIMLKYEFGYNVNFKSPRYF